MKIAVLTGRRAEGEVRRVVENLSREGLEVDVVVLPIDIVALASKDVIERVVREIEQDYDLIIAPGTVAIPLEELRSISEKIVKGPNNPNQLLFLSRTDPSYIQEALEKGVLSPTTSVERALKELASLLSAKPGISVCGVKAVIRPPPFLIVAEVFAKKDKRDIVDKSVALYNRGADIVVVGFGPEWSREDALDVLEKVAEKNIALGVDSPDKELVAEAIARGYACLALSAWPGDSLLDYLPKGTPVVVIPSEPGKAPNDPLERVEKLAKGVEEARSRGLLPLADPLLEPPLMGLGESIVAYYYASKKLDVPLVAGIANVYELMDVDSHGVIAVLVALLGELGASVLLVGEESRKAEMAVTETAVAATMVSTALLEKTLPKDLGIDLLVVKEKRRLEGARLPSRPAMRLNASHLAEWYGFRQDLQGSHLIRVEDGVIRDAYIGRKGTIEVRGRSGVELYKAIAYLGLASEPSHYAFLGYELCKAELAAKLKKSYVMESQILVPPWEKPFFSVRKAVKNASREAGGD